MSSLLGMARQRAACSSISRAFNRPQSRIPQLSRITRRTIFGVGDPVTIATISACKTLLWGTISLNGAVFGAWWWANRGSNNVAGGRIRAMNTRQTTEQRMQNALNDNFILKSDDLQKGKYWTLLTSAFSHIEPYHIMGNMFALHAFSSVLIYSGVPPMALGVLMLGSAVSGSLAFMAHDRSRAKGVPSAFKVQHAALGASGMVMGLGAAAAMLAPTTTMLLFGVVPVPMWVLYAGYTVYDTYYIDNPMSRTGHAAHLGGGAFGAVFYALILRRLGGIL